MRSLTQGLFVFLISLGLCADAQAIIFAPAFNYTSEETNGAESSSLMADLRLGTLVGTSFYLGGIYHIQRDDSGGSETNAWAAGPSAGLYLGNFSFIVSYHMLAEYDTSGNNKHTDGSGPQVDVAYALDLGSNVKLGPQFTWREITYEKPTTLKISTLRPYVALFFEF